ncbi:hypothetical protein BDV12DRAFT_199036 [Aspergillus spectabilis]
MKFFSAGTVALTGVCALVSASLTQAAATTDDASLVLTFKPRPGKGPQILELFNECAEYIHENQHGVLSAYGFKITGKEEYVFVERYDTIDDLMAWANSPTHSQFLGRFIPLIDIFGSGQSASVPLLDIISRFHPTS